MVFKGVMARSAFFQYPRFNINGSFLRVGGRGGWIRGEWPDPIRRGVQLLDTVSYQAVPFCRRMRDRFQTNSDLHLVAAFDNHNMGNEKDSKDTLSGVSGVRTEDSECLPMRPSRRDLRKGRL